MGGCPPDDGPCLKVTPDQCMNDRQCPSSMKCCSRACFRQCVPRVSGKWPLTVPTTQAPSPRASGHKARLIQASCIAVKLGKCPVDKLHCLSPIKHTCNKDFDCSGKKRCCLGACGRDCRDPSKGTAPGGQDRAFPSSLALVSAGHLPQKRGPP